VQQDRIRRKESMSSEQVSDSSENRTILSPWWLLAILLLVSLGVRLALAPILMNSRDRRDYISSAHKTLRYGVARYYEPTDEYHGVANDAGERGVPLTYPPIQIYCYWVVGHIYDWFDPGFREIVGGRKLPYRSLPLNYLIKAPLFFFDLLLTAAIFLFLRFRIGDKMALICAALYALNPAVLFVGALWAQPDSIHSAFLVLAAGFLILRKPALSLTMMTLALLSKPQPMIFAPLVLLLVLRWYPLKESLRAVLAAAGAALIVFLPILVDPNRVSLIANMISVIRRVNPVVSANAHNFWWMVLSPFGVDARRLDDQTGVFLGLSYFVISLLIVLAIYGVVLTGVLKRARENLSFEPFAYLGLAFFVFGVRMHENHSIQILPLLVMTGLALTHQRVVFVLLSLAFTSNMALHSPEIVGQEATALVNVARILNSVLVVGVFGYWSLEIYRRLRSGFNDL
jgi:hypothetical protein